jgi:hypothetical protein
MNTARAVSNSDYIESRVPDQVPNARPTSTLRKLENPGDIWVSEWRDPDSNRGHHDFQSCGLGWPEARNPWKTSDSPLTRASRRSPLFTRFCTQFRRWRRLISFFRRRLERRDRRCLEEAVLMSYTEPEATRVRSGEGLAQSRQGAAGWTRSRLPSSVQGGSGRREARVAEARWNPDGTRAPDVVPDV